MLKLFCSDSITRFWTALARPSRLPAAFAFAAPELFEHSARVSSQLDECTKNVQRLSMEVQRLRVFIRRVMACDRDGVSQHTTGLVKKYERPIYSRTLDCFGIFPLRRPLPLRATR